MAGLILVVDDECDLVATLEYNLRKEGYDTRSVSTGKGAIKAVQQKTYPDLILLDLMLPDVSGFDVCRTLRSDAATAEIPIIMLTAKGDEIDRVVGFEIGADDYVVKPFSVRELMLRVNAVLKRVGNADATEADQLSFGELCVARDAHRVWVADKEVALTAHRGLR